MRNKPTDLEIAMARGAVAAFSPERPMIAGPNVHRDMVASGQFRDLMDRARVCGPLDVVTPQMFGVRCDVP